MLDATELRRASATDAGAVQQYLQSIDSDDLNALLDQFADAESKKKDDADAHEWLALVHVLLRTQVTRQRTATRIIQSLWRGNASEMEALRWVTEISLGYLASVSQATGSNAAVETLAVAKELDVVLQIVFKFIRDAMAPSASMAESHSHSGSMKKTLPQLLALVPVLLNLLVDSSSRRQDSGVGASEDRGVSEVLHEHVVQLLELPWELRSVAYLLELLREHSSLVSLDGWAQLHESVELLVSQPNAEGLPTDSLNPLIRECLLLAASRGSEDAQAAAWIRLARVLVRRLPSHLRQEAEFNVQMCLHQSPSLASQLCDALLQSNAASTDDARLAIDTSDAVLLLHAIRASKPLLHHHLIGSVLTNASSDTNSVFSKAQNLIAVLLRAQSSTDKSLRHALTSVIEFGGRQPHARVWKAQLLHEVSRFWMGDGRVDAANIGCLTMENVFVVVAEVREEILQGLLEAARVQGKSEGALFQLERLTRIHTSLVAPYRQRIEDWVSSLAHLSQLQHQATMLAAGFRVMAPLVATVRDFFNFAMVLLRKQLSSPHAADRALAIDVWCTWLENSLTFDAQQEEEVVMAIKHAIEQSQQRVGMFYRLERVFNRKEALRAGSLSEFHRLLATTLGDFLERASDESGDFDGEREVMEEESGAEEHDARSPWSGRGARNFRRFEVASLDQFFAQDSSVAAALELGSLFDSVFSCLVGIERFVERQSHVSKAALDDSWLGSDVLRWMSVLLRHREEFFVWVSSGKSGRSTAIGQAELRVTDKRFPWALAARVGLGCAFCNLTLGRQIEEPSCSSKTWELVEIQLCLARLWRKFTVSTPLPSVSVSAKDHLLDTKLLEAAARTLRPYATQTLAEMASTVTRPQHKTPSKLTSDGASLDAMLFVFDAYVESLSVTQHRPVDFTSAKAEWDALLTFFKAVTSTAAAFTDTEGGVVSEAVFTTYAETLASQFPKSMRHLVASESPSSVVVTLDARVCDELLSRACVAMAKAFEAASAADRSVAVADKSLIPQLLSNLKRVMDRDAFSKFRVACVALVRRLQQHNQHTHDDIAETIYALMCDHVVHQLPLLRGLLSLSFPSASSLSGRYTAALDRAASVLDACGFLRSSKGDDKDVHPTKRIKNGKKATNTVKAKSIKQQDDMRVRRKRLRQIDEDDNEEDAPADTAEQSTDEADKSPEALLAVSSNLLGNHQRPPRLATAASQAAALFAALSMIESIHSQATNQWLAATKSAKARKVAVDHDTLLVHVSRIHSLLATTVFVSIDISWASSRTLSKLLSLLEGAVRVGKSCSVVALASSQVEAQRVRVFESSVQLAVRGRAWLALLREATASALAKSRLSATILKLDVFLLDVPTLVTSLLTSLSLFADAKRGLRMFLSKVETDLASSTASAAKSDTAPVHKASSASTQKPAGSNKRHLIGVVPIIHKKRRKRLRSRHPFIDSCLAEEDGDDAFADLEDFIA